MGGWPPVRWPVTGLPEVALSNFDRDFCYSGRVRISKDAALFDRNLYRTGPSLGGPLRLWRLDRVQSMGRFVDAMKSTI